MLRDVVQLCEQLIQEGEPNFCKNGAVFMGTFGLILGNREGQTPEETGPDATCAVLKEVPDVGAF